MSAFQTYRSAWNGCVVIAATATLVCGCDESVPLNSRNSATPERSTETTAISLIREPDAQPRVFKGTCDGSAAAFLEADLIVVANDEDSFLRIYRTFGGDPVAAPLDIKSHLSLVEDEPDIEAAAVAGDRIYWITSHGRKNSGKSDPDRYRFFATQWKQGALGTIGGARTDLLNQERIDFLGLGEVERIEEKKGKPPEEGGINFEGLAARPDGTLLIGLRSPLRDDGGPQGSALIVPLENPADLIRTDAEDAGDAKLIPKLGKPLPVNLGGNGIRDMTAFRDGHLLIAGPPGKSGTFEIYFWNGSSELAEKVPADLGGLRPEALVALPEGKVLILSDDGDNPVPHQAGTICKDADAKNRSFTGRLFTVRATGASQGRE